MQWAVSRQVVAVEAHPGADRLSVVRIPVEGVTVVTGRNDFQTGQVAIFCPAGAVLPAALAEGRGNYLGGAAKNRVKVATIRGVESMGILLPDQPELGAVGEDIHEKLGIVKFEPPVPTTLSGNVLMAGDLRYTQFDVESWYKWRDELVLGERVVITEKIHGSQVTLIRAPDGSVAYGSKGLLSQGKLLVPNDTNSYWRALIACGLVNMFQNHAAMTALGMGLGHTVQVFGELFPCQKGFKYGQTSPTVRLYEARVNGASVPYTEERFSAFTGNALWVPVLHDGPYDPAQAASLACGSEAVSGQSHHMREGVVVRPFVDRCAAKGWRLGLKILNPDYRLQETGDELA